MDTTVQEKNISFPTDAKLYYKVAEQLWEVGERQKQWLWTVDIAERK